MHYSLKSSALASGGVAPSDCATVSDNVDYVQGAMPLKPSDGVGLALIMGVYTLAQDAHGAWVSAIGDPSQPQGQ